MCPPFVVRYNSVRLFKHLVTCHFLVCTVSCMQVCACPDKVQAMLQLSFLCFPQALQMLSTSPPRVKRIIKGLLDLLTGLHYLSEPA